MAAPELIIKFEEAGGDQLKVDQVGGKAASLIKLTQAQLPIPSGFVITTQAFSNYYKQPLPDDVENEILQAFDSLETQRVAVRSSAIAEDSSDKSWAGQFESYLNTERADVIQRVQDCWDSIEGARQYAATQDVSEAELALAVVVQKMIDSEVSGVAFSVNPLSHDPDEIMIEATYGLGELLVQGMVTPDNYVVSKSGKSVVSSNIAVKPTMLTYQNGDTKETPVSEDIQNSPCLSEEQLLELCTLICQVEDYYKSPQDIEWALKDNKFYLLQSRPITTT